MNYYSSLVTRCSLLGFIKHLFFLALVSASPAFAREEKIPILLVEPSFLHAPISSSIPGAQRTVIVPAMLEQDKSGRETTSFLQPGWKTIRQQSMNHFVHDARDHLSKKLATLHPKFLRDEHQVIQVALLESPHPLTASTILSVDFSSYFATIFGPDLLIAIPSANKVYIFSKLASPLDNIAPSIRADYKLSTSPISTEIFELSKGELHAIGSLD